MPNRHVARLRPGETATFEDRLRLQNSVAERQMPKSVEGHEVAFWYLHRERLV